MKPTSLKLARPGERYQTVVLRRHDSTRETIHVADWSIDFSRPLVIDRGTRLDVYRYAGYSQAGDNVISFFDWVSQEPT